MLKKALKTFKKNRYIKGKKERKGMDVGVGEVVVVVRSG